MRNTGSDGNDALYTRRAPCTWLRRRSADIHSDATADTNASCIANLPDRSRSNTALLRW